jgi:hypothetical protein
VSFLNGAMVKAIANLRGTYGDAELTVGDPPIVRTLFIKKGELVGGFSNDPEERIGTLVANSKGLAHELIEAIATSAAKKGKMLGDELINEGLISPSELVELLEQQSVGRFRRSLMMMGTVRSKPLSTMRGVIRRPVGALLVSAFREHLPATLIETLAIFVPSTPYAVTAKENELDELGLTSGESRALRKLGQGESLQQTLAGPQGDAVQRVVLALLALGMLRAKPSP